MRQRLGEILLALVAIGLITVGAGMIYRPLAPIVAGAALLVELVTRKGRRP